MTADQISPRRPSKGELCIIHHNKGYIEISTGNINLHHDDLHVIDGIVESEKEVQILARRRKRISIYETFTEHEGFVTIKKVNIGFEEFLTKFAYDRETAVKTYHKHRWWKKLFGLPATTYKYIHIKDSWNMYNPTKITLKQEYWLPQEYISNNYIFINY